MDRCNLSHCCVIKWHWPLLNPAKVTVDLFYSRMLIRRQMRLPQMKRVNQFFNEKSQGDATMLETVGIRR